MNRVHAAAEKSIKNVVVVRKPFVIPGFLVNAVECSMRYKNRPDLGLILSEDSSGSPCVAVFTKNVFTAAPVEVSKNHLERSNGIVKAVLVNAGIANACTGKAGIKNAEESCKIIAERLGVSHEAVVVASTGVIGPHIDTKKIGKHAVSLVRGLREDKWDIFARAIMTTDTVPKFAYGEIETDIGKICIGGVAKGSGMIAPNMATMLAFVCANVYVEPSLLQPTFKEIVDETFNCISVDGDTSTNDMVVLLTRGSGCSEKINGAHSKEFDAFKALLYKVCEDLARQIVEDGEGATKFVEIRVEGASSRDDARKIAKCIAESPLVKTAFFGCDANWGRIVAAAGRAGINFDPYGVSLFFDDLCVFKEGIPLLDDSTEKKAAEIFRKNSFVVTLKLQEGNSWARVWTCDLSHGYVDINASYRT